MTSNEQPKKRPAFQFYPGDWRRDPALQACSVPARGLWIELMCLMHESLEYGVLTINGQSPTPQIIARLVGASPREVTNWLADLEGNGVFSRDEQGRIYSRRMVKDERVRNARAQGGEEGAAHGAKGGSHGNKGGRPTLYKGGSKTPLPEDEKPPPSSSSSSSSSLPEEGSAEPAIADSAPPAAVISLPTNNGQEFQVLETKVSEWEVTYPGVDVPQTLREIRQWLKDNPSRRKTARGMHAFVNRWLMKEQNGGRYG